MVHSAPDMLYSLELCSVLSLIRTHTHTNRAKTAQLESLIVLSLLFANAKVFVSNFNSRKHTFSLMVCFCKFRAVDLQLWKPRLSTNEKTIRLCGVC